MRDPHPLNELGTGALDATVERRLTAQGVTFARRVAEPKGRASLMLFSRPVAATLAAMRDHGRKLVKDITTRTTKTKSAPAGGAPVNG